MELTRRKRVLIVGAGGFAGGFLAVEGLNRGYEVWAGVRKSTSREYLQDERLKFINFEFDNPETLATVLTEALPEGKKWDYVIYNLGATKALRFSDFSRINYDYLRYFTVALQKAGKVPDKFLYMSSLSAMGPGDEKNYTPFTEKMIPHPNTKYGASKLKAEMWLATAGLPTIIFRPTGIYGPREKDYFLMFESIKKGFDFSVGFRRQMLTFIYVEDLVRAAYDALEHAPVGETYLISESRGYSQKEFRKMALQSMGRKFALPMRMPLCIVKAVSAVVEKWGVARMKPTTLNRDKFNIMAQRNWSVDTTKAERDFGFRARTSLKEGIDKSIKWYVENGWL